ncbi:hypothetical protein ABIB25_000960 [Nakamurella sp. UYEF19]|uniref:hypothetical protein n=1 Tax=Nakamurella sp. UYEF19 TaxID=1756392 RepID=UPI003398164C
MPEPDILASRLGVDLRGCEVKPSLFDPRWPKDKWDPQFAHLHAPAYAAARRLLDATFQTMVDVDGNFGRDFATTGFSPRLFELAMFAYLDEFGLVPPAGRRDHHPDFIIGGGRDVAVEVTTSNPTHGSPAVGSKVPADLADLMPSDAMEARRRLVFQFGKVVRAKLQWSNGVGQRYWELPHTRDLPFVVAYGAFHDSAALWLSGNAIAEYLYGQTDRVDYVDGKLILTPEPLIEHHCGDKNPIPSGLFRQPEAQRLAGVLFSNEHTAPKFLRIGLERGYGDDRVLAMRVGFEYDLDPNASTPKGFTYRVGERPATDLETFAEGLHLFINPWCESSLSPELFPELMVHQLLPDGRFLTTYPPGTTLHPVASRTAVIQITD